jgi:hypothetical protein
VRSRLPLPIGAAPTTILAPAGEEGGPENIQSVVQDLKVDRIDHGVRCLDDPQLVAALEDSGIALTVCPLSNLCLKVYDGELEAKLKQLCSTKLAITVNRSGCTAAPAPRQPYLPPCLPRGQCLPDLSMRCWLSLLKRAQ